MIVFSRVVGAASLRAKAGGPSGLLLDVQHWVTIDEDKGVSGAGPQRSERVRTTAYEYRLLDLFGTELLVFHWQPGTRFSGPDFPHLHVSAALTARVSVTVSQRLPLDKRHVPTGLVTPADIVRLLIAEFGAAERHRDWPRRLRRAEPVVRRSLPERS
jgi:hypothetical protein